MRFPNWCLLLLLPGVSVRADAPIDPLWQSESFRRAFTASYGIDARIEPTITAGERAVLESVAEAMKAGNRDAAVSALTGSALLAESPALLFSLGNLRFEQEKVEEAEGHFTKAIGLFPSFRDAHRNLAVALVQRGLSEEARPHLIRALELGARDGLTLGLLGYVHAGEGRHQAALQAYRLAQLTMPEEPQWKLGEAEALLALDDPQATASIYDELIAARPENAIYWIGQADAFQRLARPLDAIANLEITRHLGKLGAAETVALGHLYLNEGMLASAVACYRSGIGAAEPPAFARAVDAVDALCRFRHWEQARDVAGAVAGLPEGEGRPADETARFDRCLALIELEAGDAATGAELVEGVVAKNPADGAALLLLGRFRAKEGRHGEAAMLFEQAAADPEVEAEALRRHGQLLVEGKDFDEALKLLEQALALQPDPNLAAYVDTLRRLAE